MVEWWGCAPGAHPLLWEMVPNQLLALQSWGSAAAATPMTAILLSLFLYSPYRPSGNTGNSQRETINERDCMVDISRWEPWPER